MLTGKIEKNMETAILCIGAIWVVVKIMVPFWHLIFRLP